MLHGHEIATRVTVRHYRKGKELAPIANDHYYDYKYQDFRILPKEVPVKSVSKESLFRPFCIVLIITLARSSPGPLEQESSQ